jgi:hypothetical protein
VRIEPLDGSISKHEVELVATNVAHKAPGDLPPVARLSGQPSNASVEAGDQRDIAVRTIDAGQLNPSTDRDPILSRQRKYGPGRWGKY